MTTLPPSPANDSKQTAFDFPQSSPGAFHAKTSLSLAVDRGLKLRAADYGQRSFDLLANYDPNTSSWRTSQTSLADPANNRGGGLAEFSETWPRSGMMRSGTAYQLPLSALHIPEIGCGFWPTPNKSNGFAPFSMLTMQRKQSGQTRPSGCKMGFDLRWEPRAVPYLVDGWINPILSEWLMGFPIGHTDLPDAETL
jgi:hypothetical protein